jgi:adenosine deaminase
VQELAARGVVLDCCPTSNVVLGVYASYEDHPLPRLRGAGVKVTLGSDDPPYFGSTIAGEYQICAQRMGLSEDDLRDITGTAIDAAFCDDRLKATLRARL